MKTLACRDAGVDCDFVARGATEDDVLGAAKQHAQREHGYQDSAFTPQMMKQMRGLIKDDGARRSA